MTLTKLAQLAHVSVSTVSKAFSMSPEIHPDTRESIFKIAKEQGCFKKYYKIKYPKLVIAVICPEFKYADAVSALQQHLEELGCEICVASTNFSAKTEMELLEYYDRYTEVDGVIIIDGQTETEGIYDLPIAAICCPKAMINVELNDDGAIKEAVDYFKAQGAEKIAFIGEPLTYKRAVLFEKHCPEGIVQTAQSRFERGGYQAMEKLFESGNLPRAIICAYDYMAMGAIRCIFDHGLSVPEDVAVMGINNIHHCSYLNPPLSSIDIRINEGCCLAADALLAHIRGEEHRSSIKVASKIHYRKSTELN